MSGDAAWIESGGDVGRLGLLRRFGRAEPVVDGRGGRALVFPDVGAIADVSGPDAGVGALAAAEARLRRHGVRVAVGPLEGNTVLAYRACVGPWAEPTFPGEPVAPPEPWRRLGWREEARYRTTRCANAPQIERGRSLPSGWTTRPLRFDRLDEELPVLWALTDAAFRDAWRYTPPPLEAFAAVYAPMRARLGAFDARWITLVCAPGGAVVGYLYAWPDAGRSSSRPSPCTRRRAGSVSRPISWPRSTRWQRNTGCPTAFTP